MMASSLKSPVEVDRNFEFLGPEIRLKKNQDLELSQILRSRPFLIVAGAIKIQSESGEILQLLGPGEIGGIEGLFAQGGRTKLGARALTVEVTLRLYPSFEERAAWLDSNPALLNHFLAVVSTRSLRAQMVYHRSKKTLAEKTILFLADLDERFGIPYGQFRIINLPLTKIEMASILASTQESVVRVISEMRRNGLLSPHGKRFVIQKPQELARLKNEIESRAGGGTGL